MRRIFGKPVAALLMVTSVLAASLSVAAPAQAYEDGSGFWVFASVDTGDCDILAGNTENVVDSGDTCNMSDDADGTYFHKDPGGIAIKAEYIYRGDTVAKVEFHPHGEVLYVYDLTNDSDSIHVKLRYKSHNWYSKGVVSPPGTSDRVEYKRVNYSFVEGTDIQLAVYDDRGGDWMTTFTLGQA